jgi:hypothetical protein
MRWNLGTTPAQEIISILTADHDKLASERNL